jgi:hypothetical protein
MTAQAPPYPVDPDVRIEALQSALCEYAIRFENLKSVAQASADVAAHWKERHDIVLQKHIECCGIAKAAPEPVAWQYRVKYDKGNSRENEWCDWHHTSELYYTSLCKEIAAGRDRIEVRALYASTEDK